MSNESTNRRSARLEEAVAWYARLSESGADTWAAFMVWLEAHPDNRTAFDCVEDIDEELSNSDTREIDK